MKQCFTYSLFALLYGRDSKIRSNSMHSSFMATNSLSTHPAADIGQLAYSHQSCAAAEGSQLPNVKSEIPKAQSMIKGPWHTRISRRKEHSLSMKQGKISTKGDTPRIDCTGSLSLGKEVFQAQGPLLCSWVEVGEVERLHARDCLSQQKAFQVYGKLSRGRKKKGQLILSLKTK